MRTNVEAKTIDQVIAGIQALNLDAIKFKTMDSNEGYGWSREQADQHEIEYKRFLTLLVKYPETTIAPNKVVDTFWHAHILDTMKYAEDCQNVFGYFLHHFPYFGMRGAEDLVNLAKAGAATARLYQLEFSETVTEPAAYCGAASTSYCGATSAKVEAKTEQAAYCGAASASYCGASASKTATAGAEQAAYCGAASTAYCGASSDRKEKAEAAQAAYCGASASYCGASAGKVDTKAEQVAYCGAAVGANMSKLVGNEAILKTAMRPTLPRLS